MPDCSARARGEMEPPVTRDLALAHGLTAEEYDRAVQALGRTPTYAELGIFSVMWSEHCSYKSSRVHLKKLPTEGRRLIQGPGENAGVVAIGDGIAAVFKMESHNHPSYVEPYQGAATGVGGILRNIFTMGARPIASLNSLRFGSLEHPRTRYLVGGVVSGIAGYGNSIGVPTVGGEIYFHPSYNGNILVNVFSLGIARLEKIHKGIASGPGNPVIYAGSKTGRDGIHGASLLASSEFDAASESKRPTVQVGDPFAKWDLDASVVGRVTDTGRVRVVFKGQQVADVPAHALVDDAPRYRRPSARPPWQEALANLDRDAIKDIADGTRALQALSTSLNLCSREEVYTEYDHMVRSNTVVNPGSDAAVIRLKGTKLALALTVDCNARYCHLDPADGARLEVAEAARNLACAGAWPLGTTDCLNFGNPEKPEVMWQFERAIEGIADACRVLDAPIVGGNVSFYNETEGKGIHPTPTIAMVGFLEDVKGALTQWFRKDGDVVLLLGEPAGSLAGSEYLALLHGLEAGRPQPGGLARRKALHDLLRALRDP